MRFAYSPSSFHLAFKKVNSIVSILAKLDIEDIALK